MHFDTSHAAIAHAGFRLVIINHLGKMALRSILAFALAHTAAAALIGVDLVRVRLSPAAARATTCATTRAAAC